MMAIKIKEKLAPRVELSRLRNEVSKWKACYNDYGTITTWIIYKVWKDMPMAENVRFYH